jgi:hypothetical protein
MNAALRTYPNNLESPAEYVLIILRSEDSQSDRLQNRQAVGNERDPLAVFYSAVPQTFIEMKVKGQKRTKGNGKREAGKTNGRRERKWIGKEGYERKGCRSCFWRSGNVPYIIVFFIKPNNFDASWTFRHNTLLTTDKICRRI